MGSRFKNNECRTISKISLIGLLIKMNKCDGHMFKYANICNIIYIIIYYTYIYNKGFGLIQFRDSRFSSIRWFDSIQFDDSGKRYRHDSLRCRARLWGSAQSAVVSQASVPHSAFNFNTSTKERRRQNNRYSQLICYKYIMW